jgi:DNA-binding transcriptional LysR family regulator
MSETVFGNLSMQWDQISAFMTFYRARSLREAAKTLNVAHTTVSRRIKELETQLGANLVADFQSHQFTEHGEHLFRELEPTLDHLRETLTSAKLAALGQSEIIVAVDDIDETDAIYTKIARYWQSDATLNIKVLHARREVIESGVAHIAVVKDRPSHQASRFPTWLIGGTRIDVEHAVYCAQHQTDETTPLYAGYDDFEIETLRDLEHDALITDAFHEDGTLNPKDRSVLVTLGFGKCALPVRGKDADPTVVELPQYGRFNLHSLNVVMHPVYRQSKPHRQLRAALINVLSGEPEQLVGGDALAENDRRSTVNSQQSTVNSQQSTKK